MRQNPSTQRSQSSAAGATASGGISAENYVDRAKAVIASRGGEGFVIRAIEGADGSAATSKPATEPQWIAWVSYWTDKRIPCAFSVKRGMAAVPTEWPEEFDYEAAYADRTARLPQVAPRQSGQRELSPRIKANLMAAGPRRKDFDMAALAEPKPVPNYSDNPVSLSPAAMRRFHPDDPYDAAVSF